MIGSPANHFFEGELPRLEDYEEEILFQHPVHDIKCNQLGALYFDPKLMGFYISKGYEYLKWIGPGKPYLVGMKPRLVWECYTGKAETSLNRFFYLNGNPYDLRYDNMILKTDVSKKDLAVLKAKEKRFFNLSVEYLIKLELRFQEWGYTKEETWDLLVLPNWLKTERRKFKDPLVKINKPRKKNRPVTVEEIESIRSHKNSGLGYVEIAEKIGEDKHRVRAIIRRYIKI